MKKLMFLMVMVMVMVFTSGSVASAQYHSTKTSYGKVQQQRRQGNLANWHKVQKQDKAKRQRTLARQRNKAERQRMLARYRSSAIRN